MISYEERKKRCRAIILEALSYREDLSDQEIQELIDETILTEGKKKHIPYEDKERLGKELFHSIRKLDMLQLLVDDPEVTEIMINGMDGIFIEKAGRLTRWEKGFETKQKLEDVIQQIVAGCNRTINEASPIADARLANGSRVNIVLNPIALNGPIVTIRRFPDNPITMEKLIALDSISKECADFLQTLVKAKYNIFISGGTGSGKTTFLNALSNFIPNDERIITIEDSAELQIQGIDNLVRLETRNANSDGCKEISMRDLIKSSLRMRPDRIVVGEVRGGEAIDMMQAYNTGHDGSLSTGHANSTEDMLTRLETMILMGMELPLEAVRRQIASGIDIIVHLGRLRDKTRKILEVSEVLGYENGEIRLHPLYRFEEENGEKKEKVIGNLVKKEELKHVEKLQAAGFA